ncbi:MAG: hypothetical protein L6413_04810 [Coriobacteriia bacterium]|nr:hypothetical protein [Coriobacteriia bacterium]
MLPSEIRIREALAGQPGLVLGTTFLPLAAIEGLMWGSRHAPMRVAAACGNIGADFAFVHASEVWADEAVGRIGECGTATMWVVDGPLGRVAADDGWDATLRQSALDPIALGRAMDRHMPQAIEQVRRGLRLEVAAIVVADDLAGAEGPLVSPDFALEEVLPRCARLAEEAALEAVPSVFHSDGDMRPLVAGIRKAGFAALHPGGLGAEQFEAVLAAARRAGMLMLGGISGDALRAGDAAAVAAGTGAALWAAAGGLLITDDGGISTSQELAALVEAFAAARRDVTQGSDS